MTAPLSPAELDDLRALAGAMIPASQAHGVPGADDAEIFAEIARGAGASVDALRRLTPDLGEGPGTLALMDRETLEARLVQAWGPDASAVYALALMHYYRDDRVMTALGLEPRPPFPLGHPLEDADPALLAPVKARAPFWRPAT
jgi:hypothetical protein